MEEQAPLGLGLVEGIVFAGRYRVLRRLGAGGMGAVYEALHAQTDRRCALKVMHAHIAERQDLRERFALEARLAARVGGGGVVDVLDAGVDEATGAPFLVMELLRGEDLSQRLKRLGRLSPDEAVRALHETAVALDTMHRASVIHRDLKPGNLFLAEQDGQARIKVLDFGVAKLMAEGAATGTATAVGTPLYMAPEQLQGAKITAAVDRYALGMIAYTFLTGEAYWAQELARHDNLLAFALVTTRGPGERASARAARRGVELPPAFDAWFAKATQVDPSGRFASARAAVEALADVWGIDVPRGGDEPTDAGEARGERAAEVGTGAADARAGGEGDGRTLTADGGGAAAVERSATAQGDDLAALVLTERVPVGNLAALAPTEQVPVDGLAARAPKERAPRTPGRAPWGRRALGAVGVLAVVMAGATAWLGAGARPRQDAAEARPAAASPLAAPASVLACPILEASGVEAPAGWLGAAAAGAVCERARVILGGSSSRTLVPAELLSLPAQLVDRFPEDPYAAPDARATAIEAARRWASAYADGEVVREGAGFRITLVLRRPDGAEIDRAAGAGRALYEAVRDAMTPLVERGSLPAAPVPDPIVADFSRASDVGAGLALVDLALAMSHNAGGLPEECSRVAARSAELAEMGPGERWRCAYTLGLPLPEVELPPLDPASPGGLAARARVEHNARSAGDPAVIAELDRRFRRETSALGRSTLAATLSCLLQPSDPRRAEELAMLAVQADPENTIGELCSPWAQLVAVTQGTSSAAVALRAMQAWAPWDSYGWLFHAKSAGDRAVALAYARRAYLLSPLDTYVASTLADALLAAGAREEVRSIALALAGGGYPVHRLRSDLLLLRVEASEARFGAALARARQAMVVSADDAGWLRAERFEIAWHALQIALVLGRAREVADVIMERFLDPEPPPLDVAHLDVPLRLPAVCAHASPAVSRRCFARFRALRQPLSYSALPDTDAFTAGAERYAAGDLTGAARAFRPLLRTRGPFVEVLAGPMAEAFEHTGEIELVDRLEAAVDDRSAELNGASLALVRAARRAARRGAGERARALAKQVLDAWSVADEPVPAVAEMRRLAEAPRGAGR
ncbi:protein kinase domain-containing protein [Sorangium sp. So ce233]|uniref:serine/threonine-protein kinase n=1 Tax=Sorangium sp. So ce233 TaxID=3133290 RepID=UPI003F627FF2